MQDSIILNTTTPKVPQATIREQIDGYVKYWPWIILSLVLFFTAAKVYIRYSIPVFQSTTSIMIKGGGGAASELAAFSEISTIGGMDNNLLENEIEILKSKQLIARVVEALNLNITYFIEGKILKKEIYKENPFLITLIDNRSASKNTSGNFEIKVLNTSSVEVVNLSNGQKQQVDFGEVYQQGDIKFIITPQEDIKSFLESPRANILYTIQISNIDAIVSQIQSALTIDRVTRRSAVLFIKITSPIKLKSEEIINELVRQFNIDATADRNEVAQNTSIFIEKRLKIIFEELEGVEIQKVDFAKVNQIGDLSLQTSLTLTNSSQLSSQQLNLETQLELVKNMNDLLTSKDIHELLPANLGISAPGGGIDGLILNYNNLVLKRNQLLQNATEKSPIVEKFKTEILVLKANIISNLENVRNTLEVTLKDSKGQEGLMGSKLAQLPQKEREFRDILRQQTIKENLYIFLLEKREEITLTLAVTSQKAKVVDKAYSTGSPIAPNERLIFLAAILLGIILPVSLIFLNELLNNKIITRKDIERIAPSLSILGEIPKINSKDEDVVQLNDRSILAESFRILITNLRYFLPEKNKDNTGHVLFVTSTIKGEGKTTASFNLALSLAYSGHRVVLIGADIRNPQLQRYEKKLTNHKGVTEFLSSNTLTSEDLIVSYSKYEDLKLIHSGVIPPNPAELWMKDRAASLFDELKQNFDYVIVDTAPSMIVADTFLITKYADFTIYLSKSGYTDKSLIEFTKDAVKNKKLGKMAFVLNSVKLSNFGYYGSRYHTYSYGYSSSERSFMARLKSIITRN